MRCPPGGPGAVVRRRLGRRASWNSGAGRRFLQKPGPRRPGIRKKRKASAGRANAL